MACEEISIPAMRDQRSYAGMANRFAAELHGSDSNLHSSGMGQLRLPAISGPYVEKVFYQFASRSHFWSWKELEDITARYGR